MGSEQDMYDCLIVAVMNKLNCFKVDYLLVFGMTEVADGDARGGPHPFCLELSSPSNAT